MFAIETVVRMGHVDPAGTIFFARVPELAYAAFEEYLDSVGWNLGKNIHTSQILTPVVNCETQYKKPIRLGHRLRITVTPERIGDTSFTLLFGLVGLKGEERASVRITQVAVDRTTFQPTSLPQEWRDGLQALQNLATE